MTPILADGESYDFLVEGLFWIALQGDPGGGALAVAVANSDIVTIWSGSRHGIWHTQESNTGFSLIASKQQPYPITLTNHTGRTHRFNVHVFR
jgi:hypothetical protein